MTELIDEAVILDAMAPAACKGSGRWWSRIEATSHAARSQETRLQAAAPALSMCASCPIRQQCAEWAQLAQYTGIAGGSLLCDGGEVRLKAQRPSDVSAPMAA